MGMSTQMTEAPKMQARPLKAVRIQPRVSLSMLVMTPMEWAIDGLCMAPDEEIGDR